MPKLHSAVEIELQIQALLEQLQSVELTADCLLKKYENEKLNLSAFEALAIFLLHSGLFATLTDFILRKLDDGSKIPWAHFSEGLFLSAQSIEPEINEALIEGAEENFSLSHLSRTHFLDAFDSEIAKQRFARKEKFQARHQERKQQLLQEIELFRVENLTDEQDKRIRELEKRYPEALETQQLKRSMRENLAQQYLARPTKLPQDSKGNFTRISELPALKTEEEKNLLFSISQTMAEHLKGGDGLANDFAVAQLTWDNEDAALELLENVPSNPDRSWIKADLLLRARRFAELLEHVQILEQELKADPETLFSAHYLKAQALWGLAQKGSAIQILEEMVEARPDYRSAQSLLNQWKADLE